MCKHCSNNEQKYANFLKQRQQILNLWPMFKRFARCFRVTMTKITWILVVVTYCYFIFPKFYIFPIFHSTSPPHSQTCLFFSKPFSVAYQTSSMSISKLSHSSSLIIWLIVLTNFLSGTTVTRYCARLCNPHKPSSVVLTSAITFAVCFFNASIYFLLCMLLYVNKSCPKILC